MRNTSKKVGRYKAVNTGSGKFPWIVVDQDGNPALMENNPKVGKVPMGFKTQALAQAAADRLEKGR